MIESNEMAILETRLRELKFQQRLNQYTETGEQTDENGYACLNWTGTVMGKTRMPVVADPNGNYVSVRRVLYQQAFGPLDDARRLPSPGCGNVMCVKPAHLVRVPAVKRTVVSTALTVEELQMLDKLITNKQASNRSQALRVALEIAAGQNEPEMLVIIPSHSENDPTDLSMVV